MTTFITVLHVLVCVILVVVVLLQQGKGAEIGAVFGGGASTTVFGSRGAGNFFTRLTTGAAVVFMLTSLALSYLATRSAKDTLFPNGAPAAEQPAEKKAEPEKSPFVEVPAVAKPKPEAAAPAAPAAKTPAAKPPAGAPAPKP